MIELMTIACLTSAAFLIGRFAAEDGNQDLMILLNAVTVVVSILILVLT